MENIILIICGILITYLLYKQTKLICNESFNEVISFNDVQQYVYDTYVADVEAIRNISTVGVRLQSDNGFQFPGDLSIPGNFNLLPSGVVMMWLGYDVPQGWSLCNGLNGTPNFNDLFINPSSANPVVYIIRN